MRAALAVKDFTWISSHLRRQKRALPSRSGSNIRDLTSDIVRIVTSRTLSKVGRVTIGIPISDRRLWVLRNFFMVQSENLWTSPAWAGSTWTFKIPGQHAQTPQSFSLGNL